MASWRFSRLRAFWAACFWGWAALGIFELLLPLYGRALGASDATIGYLFAVFSITALLLRTVLGKLLDRYIRKHVFVVGLAGYVLALGLFAGASSVEMLVVARLIQGLASTAAWLTAAVLLSEWSGDERATLFGRYQAVTVWGSGVGAAWTGAITVLLDRETRKSIAGLIPLPPWLPVPWPALDVLHLVFAGNALFAAVALVFALRVREPARSVGVREGGRSLLRPLRPLLAVGLLAGIAGGLIVPVQVLLLNDRFRIGTAGATFAYAIPGVVYAVAPEPLGRWADRRGHRIAAAIGVGLPILAYLLLPFSPSLVAAGALLCIEALGISLATPSLYALVADRAPAQRGSAYGLYTMAGGLGSAAGSAAGGWLYGNWTPAAPYLLAAAFLAIATLWLVMDRMRTGVY